MCPTGGGGHPHGQTYTFPVRGGFRAWTPGTGPGRGKITGRRPAIDLEAYPMCIISGGNGAGPAGHTPTITSRGSAGRGHMRGSFGGGRRNFARLLARLGAHPLGDVVAGRLTVTGWVRYQLHPGDHAVDCRYRRACARIGWA